MRKLLIPVLALITAFAPSASAEENRALLDLLVRKKVITEKESDQVAAELAKESADSSANKIVLSSAVSELKLGGDLRLRYQYDNRDSQVDPPGIGSDEDRSPTGAQRSRYRFRLRLNAEFKLGENWFGGVQLQTSNAADSGNQTFENGFADYDIFISRAFAGWKNDWLRVVGGKQANPIYTTDLVWDPDIDPQGLTESVRFHKLFQPEVEEGGFSKDGKAIASKKFESPWELTLNLAQFVYDDNLENSFDNDASDDAFIFVAQLVGSYKISKGLKATIAPGVMLFNAADLSGFVNENSFGGGDGAPGVSGETRKLTILTAPGDLAFKIAGIATKIYWDFAYNTQGQERFDDIYGLFVPDSATSGFHSFHTPVDDFAWLIGIQLGQLKKGGDWQFNLNWRQTGISSVDPNLNDSDFALGELNTRGIKTSLFYSLTEAVNLGATYQYAWNLRDNLFGGQATGGAAIADSNVVQVFQFDINVKF
jgi:hypothetical protein